MSKGSRPRPSSIPIDELNNRLDTIFGKKEPMARWVPPPIPKELRTQISFEKQLGVNKLPPGRT